MTAWSSARSAPKVTHTDVISLVRLVSTALEAGAPPATVFTSLSAVTPRPAATARGWFRPSDPPSQHHLVVAALAKAAAVGAPLGPVWASCATTLRSDALRVVAQVWTLTDRTGAPPASALRSCVRLLHAEAEHRRQVDAAAAGAVATCRLLTFLPVAGPVFALALGLGIGEVYGNLPALMAVIVGILFLLVGRRWVDFLLRRTLGHGSPTATTAPLDVAQAADLLVLTLRAGAPVVTALALVASIVVGPAAHDLRRVAAAYQWGFSDADSWSAAPTTWQPLATALAVARDTGIPVGDLWEAAAADLRSADAHRRTVAAAQLGTHLVLPLGLAFLPAFMATTLIPLVMALARNAAL